MSIYEKALTELITQAPWAAAMLGLAWMLLKAAEKERAERIVNAKALGEQQRAHELQLAQLERSRLLELNNMWAGTVKRMHDESLKVDHDVTQAIKTMHSDLSQQYERMGVTQQLLNMATEKFDKES